jgi:tetratricopeptide (TPR) repeat protein
VAAASAALALLGAFVIVRAAMVSRARDLPAGAAVASPAAPEPRPAAGPAIAAVPEPFPVVGPPLDPAAGTVPLTFAPQGPSARGAAAPRPGRTVAAAGAMSPASARDLLRSGQILLRAQRYTEAADAFRRLLSARRERGMALVGLGNVAFQQKSYGDALGRGKQAVKAGGGLDAQLLLGDAYFKLEKYAEAKKAYDQALRLDPRNDTARRGLELASRRLN